MLIHGKIILKSFKHSSKQYLSQYYGYKSMPILKLKPTANPFKTIQSKSLVLTKDRMHKPQINHLDLDSVNNLLGIYKSKKL